jgi:hypothetical protein
MPGRSLRTASHAMRSGSAAAQALRVVWLVLVWSAWSV